jgi:phosphohistidine phosphatase SixA/8-oxo-dGTP pyrophosphatase MutT (NUDIX family)
MSSQVRAAGGVLWRYVDGSVRVAVVHRPKYDDWSLPKGKLDPGEPAVVGALREVREETGHEAVAGRALGVSRYRVLHRGRDVEKSVQWWAMRAGEGEFLPGSEVDRLRWLPVESALSRVSSGYDCAPLRVFAQDPPEAVTVLLVRHGSAGDRASWRGEDDARPLDQEGRRQAQALAEVLPAYGPVRVLSAPPLRCVDTVRPVAERLGLYVEPAPAAAECENADGPAALVDLLCDLAGQGQPVAVCSQGGAVPAAVAALAGPRGVADVRARKGSVWALSFTGSRLVDASYAARACD